MLHYVTLCLTVTVCQSYFHYNYVNQGNGNIMPLRVVQTSDYKSKAAESALAIKAAQLAAEAEANEALAGRQTDLQVEPNIDNNPENTDTNGQSVVPYIDAKYDINAPSRGQLLPHGYKWAKASNGDIPVESFVGGRNVKGQAIYVARGLAAPPNIGFVPGHLDDGDVCARVNVKGIDECCHEYEVLVGNYYTWVYTDNPTQHPERVTGGYEFNVTNTIYICKLFHYQDNIVYEIIGKLCGELCYISEHAGGQDVPVKEKSSTTFMLLVGAADSYGN